MRALWWRVQCLFLGHHRLEHSDVTREMFRHFGWVLTSYCFRCGTKIVEEP